MCWDYKTSILFATIEAFLIYFIFIRGFLSKDRHIRQQLYIIPSALSILAIEVIEALLWSRPEELIPIESYQSQVCPLRNRTLTLAAWTCSLFFQPFFVIYACRRSGSPFNMDIFMIPEMLSIVFGLSCLLVYVYTIFFSSQSTWLRNLSDTSYKSYMSDRTCTYIGSNGHLQWTLATVDSIFTPNAYTYVLLWGSCMIARPTRLFSGVLFFGLILFTFFLIQMHGSFEAGSLWCWSAIILHVYLSSQPYILPITDSTGGSSSNGKT